MLAKPGGAATPFGNKMFAAGDVLKVTLLVDSKMKVILSPFSAVIMF